MPDTQAAPDAQALLDQLATAEVIVRYAACLDERDWDAYPTCFSPDVELHGFGREPIRGVEAWIAFVHRALEPFRATQHMLGPPLVRIDGDAAELRTELTAQHFYREPEGQILTLWGTYRTHLVRADQGWRMRRHELVTRATRNHDAPGS